MNFTKVAIIDDDPSLIKIATLALEKIGQKDVRSFSAGEDFLEHIMSHSSLYDIILIDVNMPNILGTEVVTKIHEMNPEFSTPIIFLTGVDTPEQKKILSGYPGVIGVISKPFDPMVLTNLITALLGD